MVVAFDTNVLCLLFHPEADVPHDPATNKPIDRAQERMALLVAQLTQQEARIVIPAPVLAEFLTYASSEYLDEISSSRNFSVGPFDQRAAIEAAVVLRRAVKSGRGKKLGLTGTWQKIKIDRQIVAIAKVEGAEIIYTTDNDIQVLATDSGLQAIHVAQLPLPPSKTPLLDTAEAEDGLVQTSTRGAGASSTQPPGPPGSHSLGNTAPESAALTPPSSPPPSSSSSTLSRQSKA